VRRHTRTRGRGSTTASERTREGERACVGATVNERRARGESRDEQDGALV